MAIAEAVLCDREVSIIFEIGLTSSLTGKTGKLDRVELTLYTIYTLMFCNPWPDPTLGTKEQTENPERKEGFEG